MTTHINILHTSGEFFKQESLQLHLNFVVDTLCFAGMTIAIFSGLLPISKADLALAGIQLNHDQG